MNAGATSAAPRCEQRAPPLERQLRRDDLGLVRDHERQRGVACGTSRRRSRITAAIASPRVSARPAASMHAVAERGDLTVEHGPEERLAAGEAAVDGGPGAAGLAGDVVERGLGDPDPGDARERAVEDRGRRLTGGEALITMRQYCADRLIVSTCQASQWCSLIASSRRYFASGEHEEHGDRHDQHRRPCPRTGSGPGATAGRRGRRLRARAGASAVRRTSQERAIGLAPVGRTGFGVGLGLGRVVHATIPPSSSSRDELVHLRRDRRGPSGRGR